LVGTARVGDPQWRQAAQGCGHGAQCV